jgi:hypothetical protein
MSTTDDIDEEARREEEMIYRRATEIVDKKCKHMRVRKETTTFIALDDNLEAMVITCEECGKFIGWVIRKKTTLSQEVVRPKFIVHLDNHNSYMLKDDE